MRKLGKKGSVLTDNLIWIILGLLLLVMLLWFTVPQFKDIMSKIFGFATNNTDTVAQSCNIQCSTDQKTAFCCNKVKVTFVDKTTVTDTCNNLRGRLPAISCAETFCEGILDKC